MPSDKKIPASVGILTLNSGKTLRRALNSLTDFAEIITGHVEQGAAGMHRTSRGLIGCSGFATTLGEKCKTDTEKV